MRLKLDHDKIVFNTPRQLLECAMEYFEWCNKHPLVEVVKGQGSEPRIVDHVKNGEPVMKDNVIKIHKVRPYTIKGCCLYMGVSERYFNQFVNGLKPDDSNYQAFLEVANMIKDACYDQQYSNAAAGLLKESIVMSALDLKNKIETTNENKNINSQPLSADEIKRINDSLEEKF
ncbi:hypothetical protein L0F63_006396 [Massospora cicadina]|nr:hypothetical protein L0F63_006396 [Massospora cicadina]